MIDVAVTSAECDSEIPINLQKSSHQRKFCTRILLAHLKQSSSSFCLISWSFTIEIWSKEIARLWSLMAEKEEAEKKRESQQKQDVEDAKRRKEFQDFEQPCCQNKSVRVRSQCKVQKLWLKVFGQQKT